MREIDLQEYQRSGAHRLSAGERDALHRTASVVVEPAEGLDGEYILTPQSTVGAVEIGDLSVLIEPKIGIPQVLSLACYAIGKVKFQPEDFDYRDEYARHEGAWRFAHRTLGVVWAGQEDKPDGPS